MNGRGQRWKDMLNRQSNQTLLKGLFYWKGCDEMALSEALKQKYDLFVHFYMRLFNKTKAAKEVVYVEGIVNRTATCIHDSQ